MILIPAWVIALLTAMVMIDNILRFYGERKNLLLIGKVISWGLVTLIYSMIALEMFSIEQARAYSRWGWVIVPATELTYRYARIRWKI